MSKTSTNILIKAKSFMTVSTLMAVLLTSLATYTRSTYAAPASAFVMTVKTDNPGVSTSTQFTIPISGAGYNYDVDCNDDGIPEASGQTAG